MRKLAWLPQRHALCLWRRNGNGKPDVLRLMCGGANAHSHIKNKIVNPHRGGSRFRAQGARYLLQVPYVFGLMLIAARELRSKNLLCVEGNGSKDVL
jgi:hypothetical protein